MIYDLYFWWKGWRKIAKTCYYQKDGLCSVYPPSVAGRWVIICNLQPSYSPRDFNEVRSFLKAVGLI